MRARNQCYPYGNKRGHSHGADGYGYWAGLERLFKKGLPGGKHVLIMERNDSCPPMDQDVIRASYNMNTIRLNLLRADFGSINGQASER